MCALVLSGDIISRGYVICKTYFVCLRDFVGLHKNGVTNLDIMLERILSLIPKKPNGDFQHGALKKFAQSVGLKSGNSISDWIAGRSKSYEGYLYQIAAVYDVSVEWLKGETDEQQKKPSEPKSEGRRAQAQALLDSFSDDDLDSIIDILSGIKGLKNK